MLRNYVGLSCSGHDNAIAIVNSSGEVVFAEASERYLQNKRAFDAPPDDMFRIASLIETHCEAGAELVLSKTWSASADAVIGETIASNQAAVARLEAARSASIDERTKLLSAFLLSRERAYLHLAQMYRTASSRAGTNLRYHLPSRAADVRAYDHHLTHAANACLTSPFERAACIVVDGMGEGNNVRCYRYRDGQLEPLASNAAPSGAALSGLGLFYTDLCLLCGFDPMRGEEWKVMGLAGHGGYEPRLHRWLAQCLRLDDLHFTRPAGEAIALARLLQESGGAHDLAGRAALAHAGQRVFEELLFALCRRVRELTGDDNLVLCGGCALNSSANGKLLGATGFRELYVPCAPADDGNAIGAALLAYREDNPHARPNTRFQTPYLGSSMSEDTLARTRSSGFRRVARLAEPELCELIAERLCEGDLVAWVQGRAEFGPRALGQRSILADPRRAEMKQRINEAVKFRESFRPFAPAVLAKHGHEYFHDYQEAPYMERTLSFRAEARARVPAAVHADGTGRLQTVKQEWNPRFHRLLSAFHRHSNVPMLINTSFNVMGKPIVHSVEDAIATFATSDLDILVIEDRLFAKR